MIISANKQVYGYNGRHTVNKGTKKAHEITAYYNQITVLIPYPFDSYNNHHSIRRLIGFKERPAVQDNQCLLNNLLKKLKFWLGYLFSPLPLLPCNDILSLLSYSHQ